MGRLWWLGGVAWLVACFSEPSDVPSSSCEPGTVGCECAQGDACASGDLVCRQSYCIPTDCDRGAMYCECDAGTCAGSLVCQDGAICLPPSGGSGSGDGPSTTSGAQGSTAVATTEPGTEDTSAISDDTGALPRYCETVPEAILCADFDDGTLAGWGPPDVRGGGTVEVLADVAISPPSPEYAAQLRVPMIGSQSAARLSAAFPARTPFSGTARAAVRVGPDCFDGMEEPPRHVIAWSFYDPSGGFVVGVRLEVNGDGGTLHQWGEATSTIPLPELTVTDTWMIVELSIDASGAASVGVDGRVWASELAPMPPDIVPFLTIGPFAESNPLDCTMWFDDVAVLP